MPMNRSYHQMATEPFINGLKNTIAILAFAKEHAAQNSIELDDLLSARLYEDMHDLRGQIYRMTDSAQLMPNRVNPAIAKIEGGLPDEEKTWDELVGRLEKTLKYVESLTEAQFEGQEDEEVVIVMGGKIKSTWKSVEYLLQFAHPNFWFHVVTAYDILRHKGVPVGKRHFINAAQIINMQVIDQPQ